MTLAWGISLAATAPAATTDGVFHGVELLRFAHQGVATQLLARRAWQVPGTVTVLRLETLQLSGRDAHGAPWYLSAPQGELRADDALQLSGGVAFLGYGADGAELQLTTPQLLFQLNHRHGSDDGQLELRWGHLELRGRGFAFSLTEQWLQIVHDVRTWRTELAPTAMALSQCSADAMRWEWAADGHLLRYEDRVHCVDEGLELHAEQLSLSGRREAAEAVIIASASGMPAHFRHTPEDGHPGVDGSAQRIDFSRRQQRITLHGEARLWRGGRWVEGERIDYHLQYPARDTTP